MDEELDMMYRALLKVSIRISCPSVDSRMIHFMLDSQLAPNYRDTWF